MTDAPADPNPYAAPKADIVAGAPGPRSLAGLRVTAGVILLLAALMNLFAAFSYAVGGMLGSGALNMGKALAERAREEGREQTPTEKQQLAAVGENLVRGAASAQRLMFLAGFLLLTVITSITAAVFMFQGRRGRFILLAALLAGAAETVSGTMTSLGWFNGFGLLAAGLAAVAGVSILQRTG